jgi:hypothetical protein
MDVAAIMSKAYEALSSDRVGKKWIRELVDRMTGDDLRRAAESGFDPITSLVNEYQLFDSNVRRVATMLIRRYWREISGELRSVPRLMRRLGRNPANRGALEDPKVVEYLNRNCVRAYHVLREYAWPPPVDLKCRVCGAVFQYDVLLLRAVDLDELNNGGRCARVVECPSCHGLVRAVF